ncbi:cyclase family protein [Flavobacterium sp. F-380]|uniref:Cyclase family protein n=1 Tax=Flavobacterium kayseriense TaxID=2764714 RepID=A0ABR7J5P1_9FLAO|nr:cyclase family protein [Flavobacterium kayseriense]MBC5840855.1 cyclase family protein [Flavobacterium kayseriense]MBC5846476.1 cyclase family protein [Flavobacterium kayseriense]MBU0940963.1 cyclase family protein [Bacteroidota bacterium]
MIATIENFKVDLSKPIDISIPITNTDENPIAWYIEKPVIEPVKFGEWVGKVSSGMSSTNFNNIFFNPHGHGTHTECLGHITRELYSINQALKQFFFMAELVSVSLEKRGEDLVITKEAVEKALNGKTPEAIIIRTVPNEDSKKSRKYSHSNPPYLEEAAARFIRECGIQHLLIDLPSVDKEKDEGRLLAHKAFWNVTDVNQLNGDARLNATITEMIFVPDTITDASYLLNLQIASFENDASPSKPVLYAIV